MIRETDLYPPVRDFLIAQGYTVRAEVNGCDVAAARGEDVVLVELKRSFSATLLFQATARQRVAESVYVAVPRDDVLRNPRRWKDVRRLLRRLELGLLLVNLRQTPPGIEIALHPEPYRRTKDRKARRVLLEEVQNRSADLNTGGSTRRRLVTAYRENVVHIACCLDRLGDLTPAQLRALGTGPKTTSILNSDFYGWFVRVGRGVYRLNERGKAAIAEYPGLTEHYRAGLDAHEAPPARPRAPETG